MLSSILLGSVIGYIYWLLFVTQQRRAFFPGEQNQKRFAISIFLAITRVAMLGGCMFYLLRSPSINLILVLISCMLTFWFIIIKYKGISV